MGTVSSPGRCPFTRWPALDDRQVPRSDVTLDTDLVPGVCKGALFAPAATRAMSSSGSLAIGSAFQAVADVGGVGGPVASGPGLPGQRGAQGRGAGDNLHRDPELAAYL